MCEGSGFKESLRAPGMLPQETLKFMVYKKVPIPNIIRELSPGPSLQPGGVAQALPNPHSNFSVWGRIGRSTLGLHVRGDTWL